MKIDIIIGGRSDLIRASALKLAAMASDATAEFNFVHTGEGIDPEFSPLIMEQLKFLPDLYLTGEGYTDTALFAEVLLAYEQQLALNKPDKVLIIGNSSSAAACALAASRQGLMIIHLDAGNRYYNKKMIAEQNELIIDQLATQMVSSNGESVINLMREGVDSLQILELGSLSSDAVFLNLGHAEDSPILDLQGLLEGSYVLVVLSSSIQVDSITAHIALFHLLESLAQKISVHVVLNENSFRSLEDIPEINLEGDDGLNIVSGHGFHEMLKLMKNAALVLTDSQSIQEETTVLGVPCLTLGHTTNRPVTLSKGTNLLVGYEATEIQEAIDTILQGDVKEAYPMEGWDGKVASRVLEMILR